MPNVDLGLSLAVFLIGWHGGGYFGASEGWYTGQWQWHAEYDADYGEPLAPPARDARTGTWTRNFTRCAVQVHCASGKSSIVFHSD